MKNKLFVPEFIIIPHQILADEELTPLDRIVYGIIYWFTKLKDGRCNASNITIAEIAFCKNPISITNSLSRLEARRYIKRVFSDESKKHRVEIIPYVFFKNTIPSIRNIRKTNSSVNESNSLINESNRQNRDSLDNDSESLPNDRVSSVDESKNLPIKKEKNDIKIAIESQNKKQNQLKVDSLVDVQKENSRITKKKNKKEQQSTPSGIDMPGRFSDRLKKYQKGVPGDKITEMMISEAIGLFLPVLPDFFTTHNPFAMKPTRKMVKKILLVYTLEELKEIIEKYNMRKTDKFRPGFKTKTIYGFCMELDGIKTYLNKSAGGLWAQRSISTPEQSKTRDDQYRESIEQGREKIRLAKEKWEREHPTINNQN